MGAFSIAFGFVSDIGVVYAATLRAKEPHLLSVSLRNIGGLKRAILRWVPLRGDLRMRGCEVIEPFQDLIPRAYRAIGTSDSAVWARPP